MSNSRYLDIFFVSLERSRYRETMVFRFDFDILSLFRKFEMGRKILKKQWVKTRCQQTIL